MKKTIKGIGIGFIVLFVLSLIMSSGDSDKSEPNRNASSKTVQLETITVDVHEFINAFDKNQLAAEQQYEGTRVQFTAYIKNISEGLTGNPYLTLNPASDEYYFGTYIKCSFDDESELLSLVNGQSIVVEGTVSSQTLGIISLKDCQAV